MTDLRELPWKLDSGNTVVLVVKQPESLALGNQIDFPDFDEPPIRGNEPIFISRKLNHWMFRLKNKPKEPFTIIASELILQASDKFLPLQILEVEVQGNNEIYFDCKNWNSFQQVKFIVGNFTPPRN